MSARGSAALAASLEASPDGLGEIARELRRLSIDEWGVGQKVEAVGRHKSYIEMMEKARQVSRFDEPVLITGESGSGKEYLAQSLYLLSQRRGTQFVSVNCPQYQEGNLTVSELFGHRKGSFTGATADRKGCFETADGGVVFLDEIGDLHLTAQVLLLRALATGEFQPLGSDRKKRVNVRIIAATNRPLEELRLGGEFRNDLFFRLRYFNIRVPALRERGDDWRLLFDYFLAQLAARHGVEKRLSAEAHRHLSQYSWPGNVRELSSLATTGYAMSSGDEIQLDSFVELLEEAQPQTAPGTNGVSSLPQRASVAGDLYQRMTREGESFWGAIRDPFLRRDIKRSEVRSVVRMGLHECGGKYNAVLPVFNLDDSEYQRFMDFLRHHDLKPSESAA